MTSSRDLDAQRSYHDRMWAGRDRVQERLRTASLMINADLASRMEDASASPEAGDLVLETSGANGAAHA